MTLHFKLNEANQKKLLWHIAWLKEIGLIESFEIEKTKQSPRTYKEADDFLTKMLEEAQTDFKNGNVFTSEEVKTNLSNWLNNRR